MEDDGVTIAEWGDCLPNCPYEEPEVVCLNDPEFPDLAYGDEFGDTRAKNYSTDYIPNNREVTKEFEYVSFECPEGYIFEDSFNTTHYALCHNWEFQQQYQTNSTCTRTFSVRLLEYINKL